MLGKHQAKKDTQRNMFGVMGVQTIFVSQRHKYICPSLGSQLPAPFQHSKKK